ncbi:MAG: protoheme IX farnesyltransferase [Verrucomicrobiales bacterium]|nr:protoheme IX farnesyltransferase [Verrucomicrobiales bacterium]
MSVSRAEPLDLVGGAEKSVWMVFTELVKARLTTLVLLTAAAGYAVGSRGHFEGWRLLHVLVGTGLLAGGAAALNQYLERDLDKLMSRTQDRPLPSGRITPRFALVFGGVGALAGMAWLWGFTTPTASALGAATLALYVLVYTPLKRVSTLNTVVGAVPGAMPPLIGWAAATDGLAAGGWSLFALQFFWQIPHFMAIAWLYREDYARAGLRMLPVVEPDGQRTGLSSVGHSLGLLTVSLSPVVFGLAGAVYLAGALVLGGAMVVLAVRFARRLDAPSARWLFLASVIYLPLVLGLLTFDAPGSGMGSR